MGIRSRLSIAPVESSSSPASMYRVIVKRAMNVPAHPDKAARPGDLFEEEKEAQEYVGVVGLTGEKELCYVLEYDRDLLAR